MSFCEHLSTSYSYTLEKDTKKLTSLVRLSVPFIFNFVVLFSEFFKISINEVHQQIKLRILKNLGAV